MPKIHALCSILHELTNRTEVDLNYYLDRIEGENESGFSMDSLVAIQIASDARALHRLADRINEAGRKLTWTEQDTGDIYAATSSARRAS